MTDIKGTGQNSCNERNNAKFGNLNANKNNRIIIYSQKCFSIRSSSDTAEITCAMN